MQPRPWDFPENRGSGSLPERVKTQQEDMRIPYIRNQTWQAADRSRGFAQA